MIVEFSLVDAFESLDYALAEDDLTNRLFACRSSIPFFFSFYNFPLD
jgi:hypothetical protein